jgi:signal transduction histidine kinase/ActR/RegA family two-component response regulator
MIKPIRSDVLAKLRLGPNRLFVIFGTLVIVVILGVAAAFIVYLRATAIRDVETEMTKLSVVLAEQTARTLQSAEIVLAAIETGLGHLDTGTPEGAQSAHELLVEKIAGVPQIKYATVLGPDGTLLISSFSYPALNVWLGDRSYFTAHRDTPGLPLVISEPIQSRTTGEWLIFVSRRRTAVDGSFAGILTTALDLLYFEDVYKAATLTEGTAISLLRRDGVLLARYPRIEAIIGRSFANGPILRELPASGGGLVRAIATMDQQPALFAPRIVPGYPLVVTPSIRENVMLAGWQRQAWVIGVVAVVAAATILVLLVLLRRLFDQVATRDTALRRQTAMLTTFIENLPVGVTLIGADMRYQAFNQLFLRLFDMEPGMLKIGDPFGKLIRHAAERGEYGPGDIETQVRKRAEQLQNPRSNYERVRPNGQVLDIRRVTLPGGEFVTVYTDITERKKLEQQLIQAQKMEAVGQLSGGVAHDFNNLLAVIIGNVEDAIEKSQDHPELKERATAALDAALRGAELVRHLLAFSRNQPLQPKLLNLGTVVRAIEPLLRRSLGENVTIENTIPNDLWSVMADPAQLENVLLNLAINSRDAMPGGGKLRLACANTSLDSSAAASVELPVGDYVTLKVSDTGTGIPPHIMPKVFDPFFTTKEVGKGSGLGLSMVYGFARQSGGAVKIYSEVGYGTEIHIYLPRIATAADSSEPTGTRPADAPAGSERILVVEDKPDVRTMAVNVLERLGYRTAEAEDAAGALEVLDRGEIFDLLFTDLIMPGSMNGIGLAREVRRRFPSIAIVFTSGFSDSNQLVEEAASVRATIISKPYLRTELAKCIRAALDRAPQSKDAD